MPALCLITWCGTAAAGLLVALVSAAIATVPPSFAPAVAYPTGAGTAPRAVAVADFDGDGALDLAVAGETAGTVKIFPGVGNGTFGPVVATLVSGSGPVALAVADLNDDGHPDLVVANATAGNLSVFVSTGNGFGFKPATTVTLSGAAPAPSALVLDHFNGDDHVDIAVANAGANRVDVLVGDGTGAFSAGDTFIFQPSPSAVATADLDGDGLLDLVLARRDGPGTVAIFLAGHDGSMFHGFGAIGAIAQPTGITTADINDDGLPDLIVTGDAANRLVILTGNGDGTFNHPVRFTVGNAPQALASDDFNHDGAADIVTANRDDDSVSVLIGAGNGNFSPAQSFGVGHQPGAVAVADLNGDTFPDIVTANGGDDSISVLLNLTGAVTPPPTPTPIPGPVIEIGSAMASAGQIAAITVNLHAKGAEVAGVQNDVGFDPTRLAITKANCSVNPAIAKTLSVSVMLQDATHAILRAIVLSFGDVLPIPDGVLYTCTFSVLGGTPPGTYPLTARAVVASNAQGDAIPGVTASDGAVVVAGPTFTPSATPTPTRTLTSSPSASATPTGSHTATPTPTVTATGTLTTTPTHTVTATGTLTTTPTPTITQTPTSAETATASPPPPSTATATLSATPTATLLRPPCAGDCNRNGIVSVDELVLAVNISLGNADVAQCRAADVDSSGRVSVDELVLAVHNSLNGCSP